jgi:2-amino-5-formylamino-6-ribosylaminopyrimidin-4(3H)-one 5'-monophosphate deformylase
MVKLRLNAGNIKNTQVHKVGVLALGSHLENHGPALPIDTDSKIASYVALTASLNSGCRFLGIIFPAYELPTIDHGIHNELKDVAYEITRTLRSAHQYLQIDRCVIVNGHGGNLPIYKCLDLIEEKSNVTIQLNNSIVENEGPHASSGELSMGKVLGILNETQIKNQADTNIYGEVGLSQFKQARLDDPGIESGAKDVEENGVYVDEVYGQQLINLAVNSVLLDIEKLSDF